MAYSQSILEGSQGRLFALWLIDRLLLSKLSYTAQEYLPKDGGVSPALSTNDPEQSVTAIHTGLHYRGSSFPGWL